MAHVNKFEYALDKMFKKRTYWLRSAIGSKRPGQPPKFSKKVVESGILKLQEIASHALAGKLAKDEFAKYAHKKKAWHIKGQGVSKKKKLFEEWFKKEFPKQKDCIYIFRGSKKCVYIGRTGNGCSRPQSHFEKFWLRDAKRIVVYPSASASQSPKLECLAIHCFEPIQNKKKSAKNKWTKECPLCVIHKDIKGELRKIFRLR